MIANILAIIFLLKLSSKTHLNAPIIVKFYHYFLFCFITKYIDLRMCVMRDGVLKVLMWLLSLFFNKTRRIAFSENFRNLAAPEK